jgi:peptide/nickel transport system ATP-binding protein
MSGDHPASGEKAPGAGTPAADAAGSGEAPAGRGAVDPLVVVDGLRTHYESERLFGGAPVKAVDGVSFEIGRGETFGVVGESGCGKTTLGRSLLRLEDPDAGSVRIDGTEVTELRGRHLTAWRRDAQMVYQDPTASINDRMTVGEIVREPLDVHDEGTPRERRAKVRDLLDRVGLRPEHYHRYPHQFSGGQRQRVGIARALALEPDFVVLDEPVSALDVSVQAKILNLLADLQAEFGLTYLLIAHDLSVVRHVCDRVGVMYLGKLMEVGPTEELFTDPSNPYTRSLLSAIPRPDPGDDDDRIRLRGTPPSPRFPPEGCVFSTRCPFKIHPDDGAALSPEVWDRVEQFRAVLRERDRAEVGPVEWVRERLGLETRFAPVEEVAAELFDPVDVPAETRAMLDTAAELAADGDAAAARERLAAAFDGPCDTDTPVEHPVGDGRTSRCHRHREEYADPGDAPLAEGDGSPRADE